MKPVRFFMALMLVLSLGAPSISLAQDEFAPEETFNSDELPDELRDASAGSSSDPSLDQPAPPMDVETAAQPIEQEPAAPAPVKKEKPAKKTAKLDKKKKAVSKKTNAAKKDSKPAKKNAQAKKAKGKTAKKDKAGKKESKKKQKKKKSA